MDDRRRRVESLNRQPPPSWDSTGLNLNQRMSPFDGSATEFGSERHHPHLNVRSQSERGRMAEHIADSMAYGINNLPLRLPSSAGSRRHDDGDGEGELNASSNSLEFAHMLTFPQQLMEILSNEDNHDIMSWLPHGKSFFVKNRDRLSAEVLPKYFDHGAEYRSFTRRLLRWGFKRVPRGDEVGAFYHEYFVKRKPELCSKIKTCSRKPSGSAKAPKRKSESSIVDEATLKEQHRRLQEQQVQLHRLQQQQLLLQQQQRSMNLHPQDELSMHQESFDIPHIGMKPPQQKIHDNLNLSNHFMNASSDVWPEANLNSKQSFIPAPQRGSGIHHAPNLLQGGRQFHDRMQNVPLNTSQGNVIQGMEQQQQGTMIGQVFTQDSNFNRDLSHRYHQNQFDMAGASQEDEFARSREQNDFTHQPSGPATFFDTPESELFMDADAVLAAAQRALHECDTLQTMGILDPSECSNFMAADLTRQQVITSNQNWQNQLDTKSRDARGRNSGAA